MPRTTLPMLSKSRFIAGLQCHKRLYYECFAPDLASPVAPAQQVMFDTGTTVGEIARLRYPGGVLIVDDHLHHAEAVERTRGVIANPSVPAVFEAAFTEDDVRIRADVLVRRDGGSWDLVEVKSSGSAKPQHVDDLAIQLATLERTGLQIDSCYLAHINREYLFAGGAHDPQQLFALTDLTEQARAKLDSISTDLAEMRDALRSEAAPQVEVGKQCRSPYVCQFIEFCHRDEPEWPVSVLPSIRSERVETLRASGIRSIGQLPDGEKLTPLQERVRRATVVGEVYVDGKLGRRIEELTPPVHFIDFETISPALPVYPGTSPFQTIPIQWSDHVLSGDGAVTHASFLAAGDEDPREDFAESLVRQLSEAGSVVVYSAYENTQLKRLQQAIEERSVELQAIRDLPWTDLLKVIRECYYHRDFRGSFSLKAVLPVMVPELGYDDLEIQDGVTASQVFLESLRAEMSEGEREQVRSDLLAYCARDTEAMVRVVEALRSAAIQ